jgi:hypothetical protein
LSFLRIDNGKTYVDYKGSRGDNWKNVDTLLLAEPSGINGYPIRLNNDKQKNIGVQITGSNPASALRMGLDHHCMVCHAVTYSDINLQFFNRLQPTAGAIF